MSVQESLLLPTRGIVYPEFNGKETVTLRPYTAKEYKDFLMSGKEESVDRLLNACLVDCPLKAEELQSHDYTAVLYKLRAITMGNTMELSSTCPYCNEVHKIKWDLSELRVRYLAPKKYPFELTLPESQQQVMMKITTPKILKNAREAAKLRARKLGVSMEEMENSFLSVCNLSMAHKDMVDLSIWYDSLPIRDVVYLTNVTEKINDFGIDTGRDYECSSCYKTYKVFMRVDGSFFRPNVGEFDGFATEEGTLEGGINHAGDVE